MNYRSVLAATAVVTCLIAGPAFAKADKAFLRDAIKGDNSEIALGKLAAEQGASDGVRNFGTTLATDHAKAKEEAAALASSMNVPVSEEIKPAARKEMNKLSRLSGQAFDKEFAMYMVKDHEMDVKEFKQKAAEGNKQVAMLAANTLPTLEQHLQTAQSLSSGQ